MLYTISVLLFSLVLTTWGAGKLLSLLISKFLQQEKDRQIGKSVENSMSRIGEIIGWLERFLVLVFVLIGYYQGVGFVLAAKSVLRYGEIKSDQDRLFAEYVIVGTLLSFSIALVMGIITRLLLGMPAK